MEEEEAFWLLALTVERLLSMQIQDEASIRYYYYHQTGLLRPK